MHNIGEQMSKASVFLSTPMSMLHDLGTVSGVPAMDEMGGRSDHFPAEHKTINTIPHEGLISKPAHHLEMWDRDIDLIHISPFIT